MGQSRAKIARPVTVNQAVDFYFLAKAQKELKLK